MSLTTDRPTTHSGSTPVSAFTSASRPRRWVRKILGGGQVVETCPSFCTDSHQFEQAGRLNELRHTGTDISVKMPVYDAEHGTIAIPVLVANLQIDPYSENPARNVPFVSFWPFEGEDMGPLDADRFADVIAQIRAHCDRLDRVHAQLVQAVTDHEAGAL